MSYLTNVTCPFYKQMGSIVTIVLLVVLLVLLVVAIATTVVLNTKSRPYHREGEELVSSTEFTSVWNQSNPTQPNGPHAKYLTCSLTKPRPSCPWLFAPHEKIFCFLRLFFGTRASYILASAHLLTFLLNNIVMLFWEVKSKLRCDSPVDSVYCRRASFRSIRILAL